MRCWLRTLAATSLFWLARASLAQEGDAREVVGLTRRILSDPEFSDAPQPSALEELYERILDGVVSVLRAIFGESTSGIAPVLGPIIVAVFIGVLLILAAWLISNVNWSRRQREDFGDYAEERMAPPNELLRLSDEAAAAGNYSRAFTLAFWAFLKLSDASDVLDYSDDSTNWEILRTMRAVGVGKFGNSARELARKFDLIEYGNGHADINDVAAVKALIERIPSAKVAA